MFRPASRAWRSTATSSGTPARRSGAAFDTGADCGRLLDFARAEGLRIQYLFLTHTHDDHVADLEPLAAGHGRRGVVRRARAGGPTRAPRPSRSQRAFPPAGPLAIKTLLTSGHSPGQTTFYVTGLSWPLAVVGDSLFASSIGGSATHFEDQYNHDRDADLHPSARHGAGVRARAADHPRPGKGAQSVLRPLTAAGIRLARAVGRSSIKAPF